MGCLLWVHCLIDILPQLLQLYMQYLTILDRVVTALDCIFVGGHIRDGSEARCVRGTSESAAMAGEAGRRPDDRNYTGIYLGCSATGLGRVQGEMWLTHCPLGKVKGHCSALRPEQNGHQFAEKIYKCIYLTWKITFVFWLKKNRWNLFQLKASHYWFRWLFEARYCL